MNDAGIIYLETQQLGLLSELTIPLKKMKVRALYLIGSNGTKVSLDEFDIKHLPCQTEGYLPSFISLYDSFRHFKKDRRFHVILSDLFPVHVLMALSDVLGLNSLNYEIIKINKKNVPEFYFSPLLPDRKKMKPDHIKILGALLDRIKNGERNSFLALHLLRISMNENLAFTSGITPFQLNPKEEPWSSNKYRKRLAYFLEPLIQQKFLIEIPSALSPIHYKGSPINLMLYKLNIERNIWGFNDEMVEYSSVSNFKKQEVTGNLRGFIITEPIIKQVIKQQHPSEVQNFYIMDKTGEIQVSLWDFEINHELHIGDIIHFYAVKSLRNEFINANQIYLTKTGRCEKIKNIDEVDEQLLIYGREFLSKRPALNIEGNDPTSDKKKG